MLCLNRLFLTIFATSNICAFDPSSDASFTHLAQCTIHPHKLYKLASVCQGFAPGDREQLASQQVSIFAHQIRGFAVLLIGDIAMRMGTCLEMMIFYCGKFTSSMVHVLVWNN